MDATGAGSLETSGNRKLFLQKGKQDVYDGGPLKS